MSSDIEICSAALIEVGAQPISDLDEDSDGAKACKRLYPVVRKAVFRAHKWNCLQTRASLAQLAETPAYGFDYYYQLPADCLRVLSTNGDEDLTTWRIEGRKLATDDGSVSILYIKDEVDPVQWDSLLEAAVVARLAAELAIPMTESRAVAKDKWDIYAAKMSEARSIDGQEGTPETVNSGDPLIVVRQ